MIGHISGNDTPTQQIDKKWRRVVMNMADEDSNSGQYTAEGVFCIGCIR